MSPMFWMAVQVVIGMAVVGGAFVTLTQSIDGETPATRRWLFVSLFVSGAWYALEPLILGVPTSTRPGLLFASFVAWVMLRWQRTLVRKAGLN